MGSREYGVCLVNPIAFSVPGSEAETELINHHLRLIDEKEQLSRRQDILNAQLDLNETELKIAQLRTKIADGGDDNDGAPFYASLRHDSNAMLLELKEMMDHKNDLMMRIADYEDEN
uniref:HAP1 N-terminal domain-containing protein n=1 Tax=Globodera pallida TaxID=36090 RepID=A0A183C497_GLOPA